MEAVRGRTCGGTYAVAILLSTCIALIFFEETPVLGVLAIGTDI